MWELGWAVGEAGEGLLHMVIREGPCEEWIFEQRLE